MSKIRWPRTSRRLKKELIDARKGYGRCFYCGLPMRPSWETEVSFLKSCGVEPNEQIKDGYTAQTVEHLRRLTDGGGWEKENLVYSHGFCNSTRQHRSPDEQKARIKTMLEEGTHPLLPLKNRERK